MATKLNLQLLAAALLFAAAGCRSGNMEYSALLALADGERGGIRRVTVSGVAAEVSEVAALPSANYLVERGGTVYCAVNTPSAGVAAMAGGRIVAEAAGHGEVACHLAVSPGGRFLYLANYGDGSVDEFVLDHSLPVWKRNWQLGPGSRAHFAGFSPDGRLVIVDLGADRVWFYEFNETDGAGALVSSVRYPKGAGPRHLVWLDDRTFATANELNDTVTVVENGAIVQTLPASAGAVKSYPGAIRLSPDRRYAAVTNRGENTVAVFSVCGNRLALVGRADCRGVWPRDCCFSTDGRRLYVALDRSARITVFDFADGAATFRLAVDDLPQPMCFLPDP